MQLCPLLIRRRGLRIQIDHKDVRLLTGCRGKVHVATGGRHRAKGLVVGGANQWSRHPVIVAALIGGFVWLVN